MVSLAAQFASAGVVIPGFYQSLAAYTEGTSREDELFAIAAVVDVPGNGADNAESCEKLKLCELRHGQNVR